MDDLSSTARLRLQLGLGVLAAAALLELLVIMAPVGSCARSTENSGLGVLVLAIPVCWGIALVLLVWGRERMTWGLVRFGGLLVVAMGLPHSVTHVLEPCFA